jgi:hypothetical protein
VNVAQMSATNDGQSYRFHAAAGTGLG